MIFVCDVMLGKLARYLRTLGFDARYVRQGEDPASFPAPSCQCVFLTRRHDRTGRPHTVVIRDNDPAKQILEIKEIIDRHVDPKAFMSRCLECNIPLIDTPKEEIEPFVPEYIYHHHDRFKTCPSCKKVYWEGSHAEEMREWLEKLIDGAAR
ncbi:MAG TPA: Mut7-C RNAse domain-containing protein [Syntrophorhabdaceae bacterium]|nr:Mut7-C RNAse domain-containing protein [Syntrophorhabdaceae bacterium]